jgi:hypothetical protein
MAKTGKRRMGVVNISVRQVRVSFCVVVCSCFRWLALSLAWPRNVWSHSSLCPSLWGDHLWGRALDPFTGDVLGEETIRLAPYWSASCGPIARCRLRETLWRVRHVLGDHVAANDEQV